MEFTVQVFEETVKYKVVLEGNTANFFQINEEDQTETCVCTQPWKPNPDGTTSDWTSAEEAVEWFQSRF